MSRRIFLARLAAAVVFLIVVFAAVTNVFSPRLKPGPGAPGAPGAESFGRRPATPPGSALAVVAFVTGQPDAAALDILRRNRGKISHLVPAWYSVAADGAVVDRSDPVVKEFARRNGIALLPAFTIARASSALLSDAPARSRAVRHITDIVMREQYAGADLRWEPPGGGFRIWFSALVRALAASLSPKQRLLTVEVPAATVGAGEESPFDLWEISEGADFVILLAHDRVAGALEPGAGASAPGALAPLSWVEGAVRATAGPAPAGKVLLAMAAYGYDWDLGSAAVGAAGAAGAVPQRAPLKRLVVGTGRARLTGGLIERETDASGHFRYVKNGRRHEVWLEDDISIMPKISLARRSRLAGIAVVSAGEETDEYWQAITRSR